MPCTSVNTGRSLETRKREHIDAVKNFDVKKSALCQHVAENDHFIDWDNLKIFRREPHWHKRLGSGRVFDKPQIFGIERFKSQ